MRIKSKYKFIRGLLIILALVSLFISKTTLSFNKINYKKISVTRGDTLWKIAKQEQETNEYYKNKDIREIVYNLKELNNLNTSNLNEGQELLIATN